MALYLLEVPLEGRDQEAFTGRLDELAATLSAGGGELIEAQAGVEAGRAYLIVDAPNPLTAQLAAQVVDLSVDDVKEVRLVGQDLETVKARASQANYLVEWNLPAGLTMEKYLQRKAEKSPLYANVPEVRFERTYVCEDMSKCLCFYDSPDKETVLKARDVVEAPVDSLSTIKKIG